MRASTATGILAGVVVCSSISIGSVRALTASVSRTAIDFPQDIYLTLSPAEPPFVKAGVNRCIIDRERGYSLLKPGFSEGVNGVNQVYAPATYVNASAVVCHMKGVRQRTTKTTTFMLDGVAVVSSTCFRRCLPASVYSTPLHSTSIHLMLERDTHVLVLVYSASAHRYPPHPPLLVSQNAP